MPDPALPQSSEPAPLDWNGTERYEIVRCLGRGGMGAVYEARDRESGQFVALKTLLNATPAALYLFKQEFRTLADVDHPNLVRLYEFALTQPERVFFTMELVRGTDFLSYVRPVVTDGDRPISKGEDLSGTRPLESQTAAAHSAGRAIEAQGPVSPLKNRTLADIGRVRQALMQLVEGVTALHAAGKLHRDIKPSNVLVTAEGRVVLLDFGVATEFFHAVDREMSEDAQVVGTAIYMAPEQAFEEATPAADWYSVGVMLYEAMVGRPPFVGSVTEVLTAKSMLDPRPPSEFVEDVPADLDALCQALLQREPAMRPSGPEILRQLEAAASPHAQPSSSAVSAARVRPTVGLVGRDQHLRVLREAFDAARDGGMVTVRVGGRSGMGKSALVHRFLDGLVEGREAIVLRGRAYEREAVPYKAVDGVIDALSRYLIYLRDDDLSAVLPQDAWTIAKLFPVLRRVPAIDALVEEPLTDPQRVRLRAFRALRELFSALARRRPLVLFVDDAQWGDTDSVGLLVELIRPPHPSPILLAMAFRQEQDQKSSFLDELQARLPRQADVRDLSVGPLRHADARHLALSLIDAGGDSLESLADAVARESGGSPFLIEELARDMASQSTIPASAPSAVAHGTLEQMVRDRLARLPDRARRCLEIIAVSGRPTPVSVAGEAAEIQEEAQDTFSLLRARRFLRSGIRNGREVLEVLHQRIRETIVSQLTPQTLREHHAQLARVLEAAPDADVEALTTHLFGAGSTERAVQFAERAAEQAARKLAFDQAAHLLRLAIETVPASTAEGSRLRTRLGEMLEWAGRSAEAGRVYLEAAQGAAPLQKLDLQRAAVEQLHASGHMDEGTQVLRGVLPAVGAWAPRSSPVALLWFLVQHLWLRVFGLRFRERQLRPEERLRLDALNAAALGFAWVDHMFGLAMKARLLVVALRSGHRVYAARGATLAALDLAGYTATETATERAFLELAERLIQEDATTQQDGSVQFTSRVARPLLLHFRGRFREAKDLLEPLHAMLTNRRVGVQSATLFLLHSIQFLGDMAELGDRYRKTLADAEERGNLFMAVILRTSTAASVWLAADDPDKARDELHEARAQWAHGTFSTLDVRAIVSEAEVELYVGDGASAYVRAKGLTWTVTKNMVLAYYVRALAAFAQGRAAIASLPGLRGTQRRARLREARRMTRIVGSRRMAWTAPLVSILEAGVARAAGRREDAESALRAAIASAEAVEMAAHAAAARYELGLSVGGDEGALLVRDAEEAMTSRGIRAPARFALMLVPGHRAESQKPSA